MIEIKWKRGSSQRPDEFEFLLDGVVPAGQIYVRESENSTPEVLKLAVTSYDHGLSRAISSERFTDLPEILSELNLSPEYTLFPSDIHTDVTVRKDDSGHITMALVNIFNVNNWKHLWSAKEYSYEIERIIVGESELKLQWGGREDMPIFELGFFLVVPQVNINSSIEKEVLTYSSAIRRLYELTEASLQAKVYTESVVMQFDFPEEVRVPCEQYLLYFAQFLRDLGVQADTALTHEAGQVLFTVTPDDKEQALDNIRAALEVYLHLPSSPVSDAGGSEIAILRLNSELQSLQSKLSLARAELQMKDAAIQLQKVTIAQLTGEVVFESLKDVTPKPKDKDKEELLGDIVSLVPIKGKGFEVNLPELLRKLKQLFKKEE